VWQHIKGTVKLRRWLSESGAADASQAAHFRGFLADERELVVGGLAPRRVRLRQCVDGEPVVGHRAMAWRRFEVRESVLACRLNRA